MPQEITQDILAQAAAAVAPAAKQAEVEQTHFPTDAVTAEQKRRAFPITDRENATIGYIIPRKDARVTDEPMRVYIDDRDAKLTLTKNFEGGVDVNVLTEGNRVASFPLLRAADDLKHESPPSLEVHFPNNGKNTFDLTRFNGIKIDGRVNTLPIEVKTGNPTIELGKNSKGFIVNVASHPKEDIGKIDVVIPSDATPRVLGNGSSDRVYIMAADKDAGAVSFSNHSYSTDVDAIITGRTNLGKKISRSVEIIRDQKGVAPGEYLTGQLELNAKNVNMDVAKANANAQAPQGQAK